MTDMKQQNGANRMKYYLEAHSENRTARDVRKGGNQHVTAILSIGRERVATVGLSKILGGTILTMYGTRRGKVVKLYEELIEDKEEKGATRTGNCLTCSSTGWLSSTEQCLNCNPQGIHRAT